MCKYNGRRLKVRRYGVILLGNKASPDTEIKLFI